MDLDTNLEANNELLVNNNNQRQAGRSRGRTTSSRQDDVDSGSIDRRNSNVVWISIFTLFMSKLLFSR